MDEEKQSKKLEAIARAYAAGEIDFGNYRQRRARIIDDCQFDVADDTLPQQQEPRELNQSRTAATPLNPAQLWGRVLLIVTAVAAGLAVILLTRIK